MKLNIACQLIRDIQCPGARFVIKYRIRIRRCVSVDMTLHHGIRDGVSVLILAGKQFRAPFPFFFTVLGNIDRFHKLLLVVDDRQFHRIGTKLFLFFVTFPVDRSLQVDIIRTDPGIGNRKIDIRSGIFRYFRFRGETCYRRLANGIDIPVIGVRFQAAQQLFVKILINFRYRPAIVRFLNFDIFRNQFIIPINIHCD